VKPSVCLSPISQPTSHRPPTSKMNQAMANSPLHTRLWRTPSCFDSFQLDSARCHIVEDGYAKKWLFDRHPFTRSIVTIAFMGASIGCLSLAIRSIPMGTAYAVWTGTSVAAVTAVGVVFFDEPTTIIRLGSIGLIVLGIVGLRLES
jgi:multidrug transporter EmrE-like cation transporter